MKKICWICLIILALAGCKGADKGNVVNQIAVDPDSSIDFPLEKGRIVPLETNDSSLMYEITQLEILDEKYFILSRDFLLTFDHNGKYQFMVSSHGQGSKEYLTISSFFIKNEELYLWDSKNYCLLVFNPQGDFLRRIPLDKKDTKRPIHRLEPYGENKYIARNVWNGMPGEIPTFSLLDKNFHEISYVEGLNMYEGTTLCAPLYYHEDSAIYWELLNDTIYKIQEAKIKPEYVVDFGKYTIPQGFKKGKSLFEQIIQVNKPENINKYATNVRFVCKENEMVYFVFGMKRANYFVVFNKNTSMTKVYGIPEAWRDKYRLALFLKMTDDKFIFALENQEDIENNQSLFIIDKKEFLP